MWPHWGSEGTHMRRKGKRVKVRFNSASPTSTVSTLTFTISTELERPTHCLLYLSLPDRLHKKAARKCRRLGFTLIRSRMTLRTLRQIGRAVQQRKDQSRDQHPNRPAHPCRFGGLGVSAEGERVQQPRDHCAAADHEPQANRNLARQGQQSSEDKNNLTDQLRHVEGECGKPGHSIVAM
jgi:hypothetical protein